MEERQRGRRNILQTMNDSKLMKRYRLDCAGIMFVVDLIRDMITSLSQLSNTIPPEMKVITTLSYMSTGKILNLLTAGEKKMLLNMLTNAATCID